MITPSGKKLIHSETIDSGKRSYLFEVRESVSGAKYVLIAEADKAAGRVSLKARLMVFQEDFSGFFRALERAAAVFIKRYRPKAYRLADVRTKHPKAYEKWSSEDDTRLVAGYKKRKGGHGAS